MPNAHPMLDANPVEVSRAPLEVPPQAAELDSFPCSVVQKIAWFLDRMSPGTAMMNIAVRVALAGPLRTDLLAEAFRQIIRRHETLRTTFAVVNGAPCQLVAPEASFDLPLIDLRSFPEETRHARAEQLAAEEAMIGFDLERGPLFRAKLLRLKADSYVLLLTMHHIISDGWSIGMVTNELGDIYESLVENKPHTLAELSIQYADYACWQREWLNSDECKTQIATLKQKLDGFSPLALPTEFPRPVKGAGTGHIRSLVLPRELTDGLKRLSDRQECTFFVTVFSAFLVLMHRESGQNEIVVRTQTAGRDRLELEPIIGWLVNSLILRTRVSSEMSFLDLLDQVRRVVLEGFEYQDVPFENLMEVLRPEQKMARHPPFQVNFILQRDLVQPWVRGGVKMTAIPSKAAGTFCDLNFFLVERPDGWRLSVDVNGDVFRPETGDRLLESFKSDLESIAANPYQSIAAMTSSGRVLSGAPVQAAETEAHYIAPRTDIERMLAAIWEEVLGIHPIGVLANFFDLGGHSLLAVPILLRIQERLGAKISLARLFADPTIQAMARQLEKPEEAHLSPFIRVQPQGAKAPFFMIGGDHWFRPLAKRLGPDQPFLGLSLSGYEARPEAPSFDQIGRDLAQLIVAEHDGPYMLGGWCVDGAVAYEVAQRLLNMGKDVKFVALMDAINPTYRRFCRSRKQSVLRIMRRFSEVCGEAFQLPAEHRFVRLREGLLDIWRQVWQAIRPGKKNEQEQAIVQNDPARQEFRKLLYRSEDLYTPQPIRVPLLLLRSKISYQESDLGWRELALGGLETVEVTGDHISMFREPDVQFLAAALARRIQSN